MNRAIAFFIPAMYGGGAERVVLNLLEGMTAKDLPLDLVLASAEGPYFDRVPQTVNIVDLKAGRIIKSILPLVRYLRTNRPRVLISHLGHANIIALVANYLSGTNTPIVVVQHNTLSAARSTLWRANLIKPMMQWLYRHADAVVTVSQAAARDLEIGLGLAEKSVQTIYNPIVDHRLLAQANEPLNEPWLQPGSPPVFLSIGRLTAQKDFTTLLRGFATVTQQLDARLIILGEGELRHELEALAQNLGIAESISLPGFVNNPYPYFKAASAFVLSSRWEGLPTVLIEALACGCPVVATDCPSGPLEILAQGHRLLRRKSGETPRRRQAQGNARQDMTEPAVTVGKYGHLVSIGDSAALAAAMIQVLDKSPETEFLVKRSQDFAVERSVTEYLQLIEKVCS